MTTFSITPTETPYSGLKVKREMNKIFATVSSFYKIHSSIIMADNREVPGVIPRHLCMYLMMQINGCTLKRTAAYFNRDNHSTTISAIRSTEKRMNKDAVFKSEVEKIIEILNT